MTTDLIVPELVEAGLELVVPAAIPSDGTCPFSLSPGIIAGALIYMSSWILFACLSVYKGAVYLRKIASE